jgi:hypothetical protein
MLSRDLCLSGFVSKNAGFSFSTPGATQSLQAATGHKIGQRDLGEPSPAPGPKPRWGVSMRLRLARVSPAIMDAYRGDRLSPAQVMAPADGAARVMLARWCSPSDRLLVRRVPPVPPSTQKSAPSASGHG